MAEETKVMALVKRAREVSWGGCDDCGFMGGEIRDVVDEMAAMLLDLEQRLAPPPVKKTAPKRANINVGGEPKSVTYSKRVEGSGFTWFIHGKKGAWDISHWESGQRLGRYPKQAEAVERCRNLDEREVDIVRGAMSLHKINKPVGG